MRVVSAESYVKQVNERVKRAKKFWDDNERCESVLQVRAAVLCDDARHATWIRTRAIFPFSPTCRSATLASLQGKMTSVRTDF